MKTAGNGEELRPNKTRLPSRPPPQFRLRAGLQLAGGGASFCFTHININITFAVTLEICNYLYLPPDLRYSVAPSTYQQRSVKMCVVFTVSSLQRSVGCAR